MELPGAELARYTVVRRLGGGGMGVVYLGRDRETGTFHALKVLRYVDPRQAVRLRSEGRLQAALDHPNIVGVTGIVEFRGLPALVMEYVPGPTLATLVEQTVLSVSEIDALGRGLLRAVAHAHARGQVHRDLKPGNVLLALDGQPRVTDFGLAAHEGSPELGTLTRQGAGTRRYMSLEQLTGTAPDPSMDVFALGAVLFELIDRVPAFPTVQGWNDALRSGGYPEPVRPDVPERFRDAIRHALADRRARDPDAGALLRRWVAESAEPDPAFRPETLALVALASTHGSDDPAHLALCQSCRDEARRGPDPAPGIRADAELPAEPDEFVGRQIELAAIAHRIAAGDRLVTVHGMAGIGKTRLVVRFARMHRESVWMCDLSEARDLDAVARAVARGLGVLLEESDPVAQLGHAIAGRGACVVILDNFEQVVALAAPTVGAWLERAPEAAFVVTSRIVLGIPGERVLRVDSLSEADAMDLFVRRATAAHQAFDRTADPDAIRRLVALLDGLPLAIELCAARVRLMSPAGIVERMGDRFRLLSGGRGRPDRHATLRTALDWSWDLLAAWERAALAQFSVFAGGFDLDAAAEVIDLTPWPDAPWPVDVVQSLIDASLVRVAGDGRFDLLVSVRDYGAEKLGQDAGPVLRRHGRWYAARADAAEQTEQPLFPELDNLVAAARAALAAGDGDLAARATVGAAQILEMRGPYRVGYALLCEVRDGPALSPLQRARVLAWIGDLARALGQTSEARASFESALAAFRELGEPWAEARTLGGIGSLACETGDAAAARSALEHALTLHRARGDRPREGRTLYELSRIELDLGRVDTARAMSEQALDLLRVAGTRHDEGEALTSRATSDAVAGRTAEAIAGFEAALAIKHEGGDRIGAALVLTNLGSLHLDFGRTKEALACLEAAAAIHREAGDRRHEGVVMGSIGATLSAEGRFDEAEGALQASLAIIRETGNRRREAAVHANLGVLYVGSGRGERAWEPFLTALALFRESGNLRGAGTVLARAADLHLAGGAVAEARAALDEAESLLSAVGDPYQLAIVACIRVQICVAEGDDQGARAALTEAERLSPIDTDPASLRGRRLARARQAVTDPGS